MEQTELSIITEEDVQNLHSNSQSKLSSHQNASNNLIRSSNGSFGDEYRKFKSIREQMQRQEPHISQKVLRAEEVEPTITDEKMTTSEEGERESEKPTKEATKVVEAKANRTAASSTSSKSY